MLASTCAQAKKRQLEGRPETLVDSGGSKSNYSFDGQEISRSELREVKEMRTSGGVISHLVHAKAMMQFGQGATFEAEEDEAAEWLEDQFNDLDNLLIDIGEDATWFPYSLAEIVETQSGDFSHVELVEPWTTMPVENEVGQVVQWEQQIKGDFGSTTTNTFAPDEIASFVLNKSNGRDKTGISEVLRAEDEIQNYKENQETINNALEYLVPHNHWIVGADGSSVIDDNELRRVRNMVNDMEGDTQFITGPGVEHDAIDLPKFDLKEITNNDLRQLCVALGVPIELASVISEGLGSGEQSGVRETYFQLEKKAKQRSLGGQFVEQIGRILLRDYSPYDHQQNVDLVFQESETLEEKKTVTDAIGDDLTVNERREIFDYSELDGPEGEDYESPGGGAEEENPLFGSDGDSGNVQLADGIDLEQFEATIEDLHTNFIEAEDTSKKLTTYNESELPEMVKTRMRQAIRGGALFDQFDSIPSSELMELRGYFADTLAEDGWSLDEMSEEISDTFGVSEDRAETIARTETQSVVQHAAEDAYTEVEEERGEEFRYKWVGDYTSDRTTDACKWLLEQTNPKHGGTPVSMDRLKELIQEAPEHDEDIKDTMARDFTPHINCRKRFVRYVE